MGRDWYRVEHKSTNISRSYDFSDWLYKNFTNDMNGISITRQDFEEELKKEKDLEETIGLKEGQVSFFKTFEDEIKEWREELSKFEEDEYVDYIEV